MHSIFRQHTLPKPQISFLFLEILGSLISETPDISIEKAIEGAYDTAWKRKIPRDQIAEIAEQLKQKDSEITKKTEEAKDAPVPKHMGTEELQWVSKLNPVELCLYIANFDFEKAHYLYCKCHFNVVTDMLRLKQEYRWKQVVTGFEQSMYGFGGGYDKSSSDNPNMPSLERNEDGSISQSSVDILSKMGF